MECLRKLLLTGFVVFFYEGSGLQIVFGLIISIIFLALYSYLQPYLMPSNNTFASFVHFQISLTLTFSLMIRISTSISSQEREQLEINDMFLSFALLFSSLSVIFTGLIFILHTFLSPNSSEYDRFITKS